MSIMQRVVRVLKNRPVMVSLVTNTCKTIIADLIAQKILEKKTHIDTRRTYVFGAFGLIYLGGWQHILFHRMFSKVEYIMRCSNVSKAYQSCFLTFLDMGIHTPLMYFPAFYTIKSIAENKTIDDVVDMYKTNIRQDLISLWKLWVPAQAFNFMFIPLYLRMPFITSVSFVWTMILSLTHGSKSI